MKRILLFQFKNDFSYMKLRAAYEQIGAQVIMVQKRDYLRPIGEIAEGKISSIYAFYNGPALMDHMVVFQIDEENQLDVFLTILRTCFAEPVAYKAVLTDTNQNWNALFLYQELQKEHEALKKMK